MAEKYGVVPPKFTKKWWEYFWDYYKIHVLVTAFVVLCVGITAVQCATREKFDLNMIYFGSTYHGEDNSNAVANGLEQFIEDVDGNGEKNIFLQELMISNQPGQEQYDYAIQTKFDLSFQDNYTFLYLIDEDNAKNMLGRGYSDGVFIPVEEWAKDTQSETLSDDKGVDYGVSLKDSKYLNENGYSNEKLYLLVKGNFKEDEKNISAYESSLRLAQELIKN